MLNGTIPKMGLGEGNHPVKQFPGSELGTDRPQRDNDKPLLCCKVDDNGLQLEDGEGGVSTPEAGTQDASHVQRGLPNINGSYVDGELQGLKVTYTLGIRNYGFYSDL